MLANSKKQPPKIPHICGIVRRKPKLAPEAVTLADAICIGDTAAEEKARKALLEKYGIWRDVSDGRYPDRNTYSAGLTEGRFNDL